MELVEPIVGVLAVGPARGADVSGTSGQRVAARQRRGLGGGRRHREYLRQRNRASATSLSIWRRSSSALPGLDPGNAIAQAAA